MKKEEISYKDLSKKQLETLKDKYIDNRLEKMSHEDLAEFVKTILTDQIKGTFGNEEEREAWKEMKDHFQDEFEQTIKEIIKNKDLEDPMSPEQKELENRLRILEERKKEKDLKSNDMW